MKRKSIWFTGPQKVEIKKDEIFIQNDDDVLVKTEYSVVSGGTEKANLMVNKNTSSQFPKALGYCSIGKVVEIGKSVKSLAVGDRVLVYHGIHASYNVRREAEITKVENKELPSIQAVFTIIASMSLGGVRKLEVEIGESAMVMGLGLLGIFSVQFAKLSGAYPVIAVDLNEERRELALKLGADYAFDPTDPDFVEKVMSVTKRKGVNACVEVTGVAKAMYQALECASYMGRISLLGCTRVSNCEIDYYTQVHRPGIKIIGAHNFIRPKVESYPHHWTHHDDCRTILDLMEFKRIHVEPIISRICKPNDAIEVYKQLCEDPKFPLGTVFDWTTE